MEPSIILTYILIVLSLIIGPLIIIVLYKTVRILSKIEEVATYVDHVRGMLEMWEQIPFEFIKKIANILTGK